MNKYATITIAILLMLSSCSSNSKGPGGDDPDPPEPGVGEWAMPMEDESFKGSWNMYLFDKSFQDALGKTTRLRYPETDGYTVHFLDKNQYYEVNPQGGEVLRGTYRIESDGTAKFEYKRTDSTKVEKAEQRLSSLTNRRYKHEMKYYMDTLPNVIMTDRKMYRKEEKVNEHWHPGVEKLHLTFEQMYGTWELVQHIKTENGVVVSETEYLGTRFEFIKAGSKFKNYAPSGKLLDQGDFTIVDDVVHMFYTIQGETRMRAAIFWITEWGVRWQGANVDGFMVHDEFMEGNKDRASNLDHIINQSTYIKVK